MEQLAAPQAEMPAARKRVMLPAWTPGAAATALIVLAVTVAYYYVSLHTLDLLVQAFLLGIFAIGLDLLWGYAGVLSLGHSAFFGVGAYAIAIAVSQMGDGMDAAAIGILAGVIGAVIVAMATGWIAFYSRTTPIYIAVITLCLALVLERLASLTGWKALSQYTGGANGLPFSLVQWSIDQWYWTSAIALGVVTIGALVLVRSDFGRILIGIRENEQRLDYLGFRVRRLKLIMFMLSAGIGAFAGVAFAAFVQFTSSNLLGLAGAVQVLVFVAVGGRGTILGPILGAVAIILIGAEVSADYPEYWQLVLGLLFVLVVVFFPRGLLPILRGAIGFLWGNSIGRAVPVAPSRAKSELVVADRGNGGRDGGGPAAFVNVVDLRKSFGSLEVLKGLTLDMRTSEILCIVGPNGAGKSTLINAITDAREWTAGQLSIDGTDAVHKDPSSIVGLKLGRTFQGTKLMESYTVADSLFVAGLKGKTPSLVRKTHRIEVSEEVHELVQATGLAQYLDTRVEDLSHGLRQALELAMALSLEPRVILLDEPTAGLTEEERVAVGKLLRDLVERRGLGVVLIEHDLDFVKEVTDRVCVLHQGRVEVEGPVEEVVESALVREIYLGVKA